MSAAQRLEDAREELHRVRDWRGPGGAMFKPWVIAAAEQKVVEAELAVEAAHTPPPPVPVKRAPKEAPAERARRIRASRERRLREARDRVDAYERRHPINEHGVRTGPSVAANDWRHRQSRVDRDVTDWLQYQNDVKAVQRLLGLLKSEGD
ncbi:hypothetical protein M3C26_06900 [Kocuria rhizophila]|uniref:hypothetical protein n=1 Tax=Kocuria rhizophila TaxID=72000 RepID=UPI0021A2683A|nr:hypothetical protein [Kocuria rhizophila]MCT1880518.1 hypothetical protein [Kocuria rhizophila]